MAGQPCPTGCGGTILPDGYCDTCGSKADAAASAAQAPPSGEAVDLPPPASSAPTSSGDPRAAPAAAPAAVGGPCPTGCGGTILADGYCDTCGAKADTAPAMVSADAVAGVQLDASLRTAGFASGSAVAGTSRRVRKDSTRTTTTRSQIGRGLVDVPPAPTVDPATVVMDVPEVAEHKRWCSSCGEPVGRSKGDRPGRTKGFCPSCRTPYDFEPKLAPGDLVAGQYEVVGCIAHGGLGWIYLAKDTALGDRWVVLKGLLNQGDDAAMAAAVAERKFLAQVSHGNIVEVFNHVAHEGAGYTVMEFVGGPSLKSILKDRRKKGEGPLPVETAIAYILAVLPAFEYLHDQGLVYCDFKPDNLIQVGDGVKLIDLGGVRRVDDPEADIYGTIGYQAPEVPTQGVSFASDLYTIGRTLAVLILDWPEYNRAEAERLPDPVDHPPLANNEPLLRWLRKACAPHPDDRFQTAANMADQLWGVLRILVAARTRTAQPSPSRVFAGAPHGDQILPWLAIDPSDPAAAFLTRLSEEPDVALDEIEQALAAGQLEQTVEVSLREASDLVELGRFNEALPIVEAILTEDPWEWRAVWVKGYAAVIRDDWNEAAAAFERCRSEVPGELAPLYGAALASEGLGQHDRTATLYDLVSTVDPSWVPAAFGLARIRDEQADVDGAVAALDRVPVTHRAHGQAQVRAAHVLAAAGRPDEATRRVDAAGLSERARAEFDVGLLESALASAGRDTRLAWEGGTLDERGIRLELEDAYRTLARTAADPAERVALVDKANAVRPVTLF